MSILVCWRDRGSDGDVEGVCLGIVGEAGLVLRRAHEMSSPRKAQHRSERRALPAAFIGGAAAGGSARGA